MRVGVCSVNIFEERRPIQDHLPIQIRKVSVLRQQVLFPDRVLRRKVQGIRDKKTDQVGLGGLVQVISCANQSN